MKILFLSRLYYPHVGGVEKHVKNISEILSKKRNITIITEQYNSKLPLIDEYSEAKVYRIPMVGISEKRKKWVIWKWFWGHRDLVKNADIIHAHDVFFWILPLRLIYPYKKYFLTFHGYEGTEIPGTKQILWHKLGEYLTEGNITIGDFIHKWYKTIATIISYGAVDKKFKNIRKNNRIIYLGRLAKDTGIMDYLQAATILNIQIDIYGDGIQLNEAKRYSMENGLKVKYFGFVPNADKYLPLYKIAFVSRYLSILEALATRVPIIAHYDSMIKKDYLSLSPFAKFVKICGSPEEIVQAYKEITTHKHQTDLMVQAGYNWVKSQTWEKLAGEYEQLWQGNQNHPNLL